jgi:hypothetical protein
MTAFVLVILACSQAILSSVAARGVPDIDDIIFKEGSVDLCVAMGELQKSQKVRFIVIVLGYCVIILVPFTVSLCMLFVA